MDLIHKFKCLLKDIFRFETSDLDFGIYRILNFKRDQIIKFIEEDLIAKVESTFAKHKKDRLENINQRYNDIKNKIIQTLGGQAFSPTEDLKEEFKNTPLGKEFLSIKEQKEEAEKIEEIKLQVFNDLYSFFSRYYEDGDFIPQYRYSIKGYKYAIPYNGEEIKLYWVNSDQYYIKTGLLFRDYTFKADSYRIIFRTVEAKEELGSNKATKERFFVLDDENSIEIDNKNLIIRFQYRELKEEELRYYDLEGGSNTSKQEKINQKSYELILEKIKDIYLKQVLTKEYKNKKNLLLYQINRFTAKNTKDYFIHKNLKKFLSEQLDYFIKSEVLNIETIEKDKYLDKHITRAKVVREIGEIIIDFLSQIEDFQRKLWEKKKFVLRTEYVITLDKIEEYAGEDFLNEILDEIIKNKEQLKEWQSLGFGEIRSREDLFLSNNLVEREYKKLPIDTTYFTQEFKEKLLEKLTEKNNLDDILDGLLIKSENWQALNTILAKYKEKIQTIYIDPPFNKEQDADYLYKVKYKDSTWATMLENRLRLARDLLNEKGSIFVRCDYNGNWIVRPLMNEIFGEENFRNEIVVKRGAPKSGLFLQFATLKSIGVMYDNLYWFSKDQNKVYGKFLKNLSEKKEGYWTSFKKIYDRPTMRYEILGIDLEEGQWMWSKERAYKAVENYKIYLEISQKTGETLEEYSKRTGITEFIRKKENTIQYWVPPKMYVLLDNNWLDISGYSSNWDFKTENSEILLKRVIESTSNEGDLVMDFFLGSGTTTAVAHKLKRKWIGVEMGEHFWTVVLPRMKRVLYYDKSGISKEKDVKEKYNEKTAGGFFKYQILEQYEDTLDNIELEENLQAQELFKDEYLLKYFLDFETRESPYLLNIEHLKNPFSYKLKVNLQEVGEPEEMIVDIPETFNYLIGLKVKKIKVRNNESKYIFILGEKESKDIAIVWRVYNGDWKEEDFKKDKEFIIKELENWKPYIIYVNGQSILTSQNWEVRYIEPEFKRLMEG
ncbi:MAG: site-specific DNA-methyltransferase [Candidatus Omnitrophica bacterium]|nr:site-specific DNA-methyltransferase [Candidatus Omnitrophota bacterium]